MFEDDDWDQPIGGIGNDKAEFNDQRSVLPPTCNCDGVKTIDTPCPIHGFGKPDKDPPYDTAPFTGGFLGTLDDIDIIYYKEED